jgi:hypothetical protein
MISLIYVFLLLLLLAELSARLGDWETWSLTMYWVTKGVTEVTGWLMVK